MFDLISFIIRSPFILCGWIIIGAVAGDMARRLMKSKDRSFVSDLILGIIGAFVGGMVAGIAGLNLPDNGITGFFANMVIATGGAALLIYLRRLITRKK